MPISPYDPNSKVYKCGNNRYKCKNTNKYFTAKSRTIFRDSNLPLWKWFYAIQMYGNHKKGISAHQLVRDIDVDIKTA
ncbi:MAG: hypothetical protein NY202_02945 [Mollicutes bacterium UO1]